MTTVLDMLKARGEEPKNASDWEAYKEKRSERRRKNYSNGISLLRAAKIPFKVLPDQPSGRRPVEVAGRILYFPEEGKWYDGDNPAQFGIRRLINYLKD